MAIRKPKPLATSPTFEKMNQTRLQHCAETARAARRTIQTSKKLAEESRKLIAKIQKNRQKTG